MSDRASKHDPTPGATKPTPSNKEFHEQLLLVDINRQQLNQTALMLEDKSGVLYLSGQDLQRWRLRRPGALIEYQGEKYYPLNAITGVSYAFDHKTLMLKIEARPEAFAEITQVVAHYATIPKPTKSDPGGFLNYDLLGTHAADSTQILGQFELGHFNRFGVGTTNMLTKDLSGHLGVARLDTTWNVDYPETRRSLRLGDTVSSPGTFGRSVRFGGIQYGTNFNTQPGFIRFPTQSAAGQAVLPSTVDVFINNALLSSQTVPPGPFSISNIPAVTGAGEVQLVVRDLLGREQLTTLPFYGSQQLLREGLEDFSYELGAARDNFGINSFDYGPGFGVGTYRRGMSERFTGEVHAEAMLNQATAGTGGDYLLPQIGTISGYLAGSHGTSGNGGLMLLGINRQSRQLSFGARTQWMTRDFTQLGLLPGQLPPVNLSSFNLSYAAGIAGSTSLTYIDQHNRDQNDVRIAALSYSVSLGKIGFVNLSAIHNLAGDKSSTIFAMLTIPLGETTSLSLSPQIGLGGSTGNHSDFITTLQRNLPRGEGYSYRILAHSYDSIEASSSLQTNRGTYNIGVAHGNGTNSERLGASGGIAVLGSDAFLSRRIDQSFAVVRVADYPNVHILADNQPAGQTDANGNALIPRLRAYDKNVISIDQNDVPLDAEIRTLKLDAVPYFRSGINMKFPIKHSHGATLTILLEDGKPLPVGATAQIIGKDDIYPTGYDGEVYVVGLDPTNKLRVSWRGQSCEFDVPFTANTDPLPHLGTFICKGVKP